MSTGADTKANSSGRRGALKRGHAASLERLAQLDDAVGGVGALGAVGGVGALGGVWIEAAELVVAQAVTGEGGCVRGADTKTNPRQSRFEPPSLAYSSD